MHSSLGDRARPRKKRKKKKIPKLGSQALTAEMESQSGSEAGDETETLKNSTLGAQGALQSPPDSVEKHSFLQNLHLFVPVGNSHLESL